jgi:3-dehydroquinate dehydratase-2
VHISNPSTREAWRHESVIAPVASGTIAGFGGLSYSLAMQAVARLLQDK